MLFRSRLNVLALDIPPLRERRDDLPLLFTHFLDQFALRFKREPVSPSPADIATLMSDDWRGNIRELQNVAMRSALGFGVEMPSSVTHTSPEAPDNASALADQLSSFERSLIQQTLAENDGRLKPTYEALGISRKTLYEKIRKHGLSEREDAPV